MATASKRVKEVRRSSITLVDETNRASKAEPSIETKRRRRAER
jgi:hypothetical protein